jgi:hypothetical protein
VHGSIGEPGLERGDDLGVLGAHGLGVGLLGIHVLGWLVSGGHGRVFRVPLDEVFQYPDGEG